MSHCPTPEELRCFLDDAATPSAQAELEAHIDGCGTCRELLAKMAETDGFSVPPAAAAGAAEPVPLHVLQHLLENATPLLMSHPHRSADPAAPGAWPSIPGYQIVEQVGRGGMGVVYKAWQASPGRFVALKMILDADYARPEELARFRREAETLARLDHPNIVRLFEVGAHEERPYFSLEYVEGGSLERRLGGAPQAMRGAAALVATLARAVHAAHEQGFIHRDLKPANILLGRLPDSTPRTSKADPHKTPATGLEAWTPKIADFGLARQVESPSDLTRTGFVAGTPAYMAPEQAVGAKTVGPPADIHALGVILYQLITGRPPFVGSAAVEVLRQVREEEAGPPSWHARRIPRDLDTICLKCLQKEPRRRYATALELADDLTRFLNGQPIRARRVGPMERAWMWARRQPVLASALVSLVIALTTGAAVSTWFAFRADRKAQEAREASAEAIRTRNALARQTASQLLAHGAERGERGQVTAGLRSMLDALQTLTGHDSEDDDLRRVIRTDLAAWSTRTATLRARLPVLDTTAVAFRPDGGALMTVHGDGSVRQWDAATFQPLGPVLRYLPDGSAPTLVMLHAAYTLDGRRLVVVGGPLYALEEKRYDRSGTRLVTPASSSGRSPMIRIWDAAHGQLLVDIPADADAFPVAITADGHLAAIVNRPRGQISIHDTATGRVLRDLRCPPVLGAAFSPDGRSLFLTHEDEVARLDAATLLAQGEPIKNGAVQAPLDFSHAPACNPDGRRLATGEINGTLRIWDGASGRPLGGGMRLRAQFATVAFSPDGTTLAAAGLDGSVELWDAITEQRLDTLAPCGVGRVVLAFSPNGRYLVCAGASETIRVWELARPVSRRADQEPGVAYDTVPQAQPVSRLGHPLGRVVFSNDRRRALFDGRVWPESRVQLWDIDAGTPAGAPVRPAHTGFKALAVSPDGKWFVTSDIDGVHTACNVNLWAAADGRSVADPLPHRNHVRAAAFHPSKPLLATGDYDGLVMLWELSLEGDRLRARPVAHWPQGAIVLALAFSPDGQTLAVGTAGAGRGQPAGKPPYLRLWNVSTGEPLGQPLSEPGEVWELNFSPDGRRLASADRDGQLLNVWDLEHRRPIGDSSFHQSGWGNIAFAPDGRHFVTGNRQGAVRLWDATTGQPLAAQLQHPGGVNALAFSPDGKLVLVGGKDGKTRLWDLATLQPLGPPIVQRHAVIGVAFRPDGRSFLTAGADGAVRRWPVPGEALTAEVDRLCRALERQTGRRMTGDLAAVPLSDGEWQERHEVEALVASVPDAFWHDERARDAEQDGDAFATAWHLERLCAFLPDQWLPHARRADALSLGGRAAEAERAYVEAARLAPPGQLALWFRQRAEACWFNGQRDRCWDFFQRAMAAAPGDWEPFADRLALSGRYAPAIPQLGTLETPAERASDLERVVECGAPASVLGWVAEREALAGRWSSAARLYAVAEERGSVSWPDFALVCLKEGDQDGYRRALVELGRQPAAGWEETLSAAWAAVCGPEAGEARPDWESILTALDRAVHDLEAARLAPQNRPLHRRNLVVARCAVLYRSGRAAEARAGLSETGHIDPRPWLVLALVRHQLGDSVGARAALTRADQERDLVPQYTPWQERLQAELLRAQVEAALNDKASRQP